MVFNFGGFKPNDFSGMGLFLFWTDCHDPPFSVKNGEDHITVFSGKLLPEGLISPSSASILSFN